MRTTLMTLVTAALIGIGAAAQAACPPNPAGGPNDLLLTSTGSGSDLDLGWKRGYSNIKIPGGSTFHTCLTGCDAGTNPVCNADGAAVTTLGDAFSPPVPIYGGNPATPVCVVVKFKTPPNGTANIQTGEIDMHVGLSAQAYLTVPSPDSICPRCSGATIGAAGTCDSGARAGQACVTDDVAHVIGFATANPDYTVSRDCLPSGAPGAAVDIANIPVTTKQASLTGSPPCPGQAQDDDCGTNNNVHRPCTSTVCTGAALNGGGVPQYCCAGATNRACFPTGADATGLGSIVRDGSTSAPTPAWPDPADKSGPATLVTAFCVPTTGNLLYDIGVGVPGPLAMIVPLTHNWSTTATPATTTTTLAPTTSSTIVAATTSTTLTPVTTTTVVTATTSTTIPGCTSPADCDDGDACTNDVCTLNSCGHTDVHSLDCAATDLGVLQQANICGNESIDAKLAKKIAAAVSNANNFLAKAKAATKPAKAAKLANKASNALKALQKQVSKAVNAKKNPISSACSATITMAAQHVRQVIADTISP